MKKYTWNSENNYFLMECPAKITVKYRRFLFWVILDGITFSWNDGQKTGFIEF